MQHLPANHFYPGSSNTLQHKAPNDAVCAFNYAYNTHITKIVPDTSIPLFSMPQSKALFTNSSDFALDLRYITESTLDAACEPLIKLGTLDLMSKGHKGLATYAGLQLSEGQAITFILH